MASARVIAVNTGTEADLVVGGKPARTAIGNRPVTGRVNVGALGLTGDEFADKANHGSHEQAVYAYAREDLDWWVERLGYELRNGQFGENITTAGLDITGALIGETWRIGTAVVQVTGPRIPCITFQSWLDEPVVAGRAALGKAVRGGWPAGRVPAGAGRWRGGGRR